MHAIMGHKIADEIKMNDKQAFLLGSIAPDAVFTWKRKMPRIILLVMLKIILEELMLRGFLRNTILWWMAGMITYWDTTRIY